MSPGLTVTPLKKAQGCFVEMAAYCPMKGKNKSEITVSLDGEKERQERCRTVFAIQYFLLSLLCQIQPHRGSPDLALLFEKHFEVEIYFVSAKYYY